jgi:integrase
MTAGRGFEPHPPPPGTGRHDIGLYPWLVAITGVRRGELCTVQIADIDVGNTAARLGHSGGGATLKHYADPVSEVDRRGAAYFAQLTTRSAAQSG